MKKRITAAFLAVLLLVVSAVPAFAETGREFVFFGGGDSQAEALNAQAGQIYDTYGVGVYFALAEGMGIPDTIAYAEQFYDETAYSDDGILLLITDEEWYLYRGGKAADLFTEEDEDTLWDSFLNSGETYAEGIEAYLEEAEWMLSVALSGDGSEPAGGQTIPEERQLPRLVDNAGLLTDSEAAALLSQLDEISERQQFDVAVVTADTLDGKTPMAYADDFYDYNGYGFGESKDGVLLLVSMEDRDWWITTTGYGITAITDAGREYMSERFLPAMSDGDYAASFAEFARLCDEFVAQAKTGEPYDSGNLPKEPVSLLWIPGAVAIGALIALIICSNLKAKLKTVRYQAAAGSYVRDNSMNITESRDLFLYTKIDRRAKPKDNSSSGSSTHTSSSGSTHGGGGGKF